MAKINVSKQDQYTEEVAKFAAYIDHDDLIVGIYSTAEDALVAEKSVALKKMKSLYKYKIQMVIK